MQEKIRDVGNVDLDSLYLNRFIFNENELTSTVIELRSQAKGGYTKTDTDHKDAEWFAPNGWKIIKYETVILSKAGDHKHEVKQISDTGIYASVWAKGHPKGEAQNNSYIEIKIVATIQKM